MTDIRELLERATADLGAAEPDAVGRIRRARARRLRRAAWAGALAATVVTAAVVIPIALLGSSSSSTSAVPAPTPRGQLDVWASRDFGLASGFGSIWALRPSVGSHIAWVDELNPVTGQRIAQVRVPAPTAFIAAGAGRVWVLTANPGGGGPSAISAVDPHTRRISTIRLSNPHAAPYRVAFAAGSAWVTMPELDQVWRLTPTTNRIRKSSINVPGQPFEIVTTGGGELWVQQLHSRQFRMIAPTRISGVLIPPYDERDALFARYAFAPAGPRSFWTVGGPVGRQTITMREFVPSFRDKKHCNACIPGNEVLVPGTTVVDAITTSEGFFVSTDRGTYFFTRAAIRADPHPTDGVDYPNALLAPDGNGVVMSSERSAMAYWVPRE